MVVMFTKLLLDWFFFFKQKTAYEMRISDWSSDVCSSDLRSQPHFVDLACRCQRHIWNADDGIGNPPRRDTPAQRAQQIIVDDRIVAARLDHEDRSFTPFGVGSPEHRDQRHLRQGVVDAFDLGGGDSLTSDSGRGGEECGGPLGLRWCAAHIEKK